MRRWGEVELPSRSPYSLSTWGRSHADLPGKHRRL